MNSFNNESAQSVIQRYSDTVYRLAFARMGNRYDADEVYQEVFLRYVRKNPMFNSEEHRKAWLIKVTLNCCRKLSGSFWNRNTEPLDEQIAFESDFDNTLYLELKKLPPKYREVIHLFYYEDMTTEEISVVLGIRSSTVRSQLTRARAMLRDILKEDDYV